MTSREKDGAVVDDPLRIAAEAVVRCHGHADDLELVRQALSKFAAAAEDASNDDARDCAWMLARLVEILRCASADPTSAGSQQHAEILQFLQTAIPILAAVLNGESESESRMEELILEGDRRWGELLELVNDLNSADQWETSRRGEISGEDDIQGDSSAEVIDMILAAIPATGQRVRPETEREPAGAAVPARKQSNSEEKRGRRQPPVTVQLEVEPDLLEAYLDDTVACLASIEASILAYEENPENAEPFKQVCRDLHTLKGASASIGLTELAGHLHDIEEAIEAQGNLRDTAGIVQVILESVDTVRRQVTALEAAAPRPAAARQGSPARKEPGPTSQTSQASSMEWNEIAHPGEESLRVKASQLDRLMDMLAELVMLRNRRDSRVVELQRINDELIRCTTRFRATRDFGEAQASSAQATSLFGELANDLLEIAGGQREICQRVSEDNLSVSQFIRQFRHELTELRRLPVSGLFRRLQRAARNAANAEGKKVRLHLMGEHAGLERSLQERLYEPLLHIVRNAVSHGIEFESQRMAVGKDPIGTVILEARGGMNLLVLEVRDDGKGLDFDALRRRGLELGLIAPDQAASQEELAQLIFRPGFSTRETASEISGRGVGMDVVASTLDRMRAWVEVDSIPGRGTTVRLSIPLRSVIEHAMVFRAGGQLFAVPMQSLQKANTWQAGQNAPAMPFTQLFGLPSPADRQATRQLVLGHGAQPRFFDGAPADDTDASVPARGRHFALLVDEIVGPEEVVVRPLPSLLRGQRLFSGVTLSGTGEQVLLFDSQRLIEFALRAARLPGGSPTAGREPAATPSRPRVLVVDDSFTARRTLVRALVHHGLETVEAGDGKEALDCLRAMDFVAVFTDLEMPRLGGLDLLREIRGGRHGTMIPVVVVSSRDEDEFRNRAHQLGATAYLTKPVKERAIAETLEMFVS